MKEISINGRTIKEELLRLARDGNQPFVASLHPEVEHVLGIRIPDLRNLAKQLVRGDWQNYLSQADTYYMEERLLHGLVLGYIRPVSIDAYLSLVDAFVPRINSWSVCDTFSFAGGQRYVHQYAEKFWLYLVHWMHSSKEYEIRFGVVMAKKYFIDEAHLSALFQQLNQIHHEGYYVKMAVAWTISECFVKFPTQTLAYLHQNELDDFTYNKSLQKIVESYRVDASTKEFIKSLKR